MKWAPLFLFLVLLMPVAAADSCLADLGDCVSDAFFDKVADLINAPLELILGYIEALLAASPDPSTYSEIWAIAVYIISMFYGLLLMYAGLNFMISGYSAQKRDNAKTWLKNILLMILLVNASYLLYVLILDVNSALTSSVFNLIDEDFFIFTLDSFTEVANEILFGSFYLLVVYFTLIILGIRYLIIAFGVALFPIGIFLYFIQPLRGFGKSILHFLLINIFISFFAALIFLVGAMLLDVSLFSDLKILVMIATFILVDALLFYFLFYGLLVGALSVFLTYKTLGALHVVKHTVRKSKKPAERQTKLSEYK